MGVEQGILVPDQARYHEEFHGVPINETKSSP